MTLGEPYIEITSRCNCRCSHCYNSSAPDRIEELTRSELDTLLVDAKALGITAVRLSGGEPLSHPDWREILGICASLGIHAMVVTNGTLIDAEAAAALRACGATVQVSLDATDQAVHDAIRGKGTHRRAMEGIRNLVLSGLAGQTNISTTISMTNISEIEPIVAFAERNTLKSVIFNRIRGDGRAKDLHAEQVPDLAAHIAFSRTMEAVSCRPRSVHVEFQPYGAGCALVRPNPLVMLRIASTGLVFPCRGFTDERFSIGDLKNEDLASIVHGRRLARVAAALFGRATSLRECSTCVWQAICPRGCGAEALLRTGTIDATDGLCGVRRIMWGTEVSRRVSRSIPEATK